MSDNQTTAQGIKYKKQTTEDITKFISFDGNGAKGKLEEWKVEKGEPVKIDTVLCIISTAQTTYAVRSSYKGVIQKLLFSEGDTIPDGENIIKIEVERKKIKSYDTAPIVEAIAQLLKKRRDSEKAIGEAKTEEERQFRMIICEEIDEKVCEKRKEMLNMYKELMNKKQKKFTNSEYEPFSISRSDANEYCKYVPRLPLDPRAREDPEYTISLRTLIPQKEKRHQFLPFFCGRSTSTYPYIEDKKGRDGEPICDQYSVMFSPPISIIAVADGCNWGNGPAEAAFRASQSFIEHISKNRDLLRSTNLVAHLCLDGIVTAHNAIIAGPHQEGKSIGTTTLLGGVLSKVILPKQKNAFPKDIKDWVFIFASIGDCKAFLWDSKKQSVEELTPDSRGDSFLDASDCGGRIGPYINGGPDLRNLEVFMAPCSEGDLLFVCSDGVHDNFDPQLQGISPKELGSEIESWNDIGADEANALKSEFRCAQLKKVMNITNSRTVDLEKLVDTVVDYCVDMTRPSQTFMQENFGKRLPSDYTRFPGKMDHTTLIALRVEEYEPHKFEEYIAEREGETANSSEADSKLNNTGIQLNRSQKNIKAAIMHEIIQEEEEEIPLVTDATPKKIHPRRRVCPNRETPKSPRSLLRRKNTIEIRPVRSNEELLKQAKELSSSCAVELKALCSLVERTSDYDIEDPAKCQDLLAKGIDNVIKTTTAITVFAVCLGFVGESERIKGAVAKLLALCRVICESNIGLQAPEFPPTISQLQQQKALVARALKLFFLSLQNK